MITDKIENIKLYKNIPQEVVEFVDKLKNGIDIGRYIINNNIYANVESYLTKPVENCRFEAHRKYIDIQILLQGHEDIHYTDVEGLNVSVPYDNQKDIEFYSDNIANTSKITLNGGNFMLIFPHEAHAPQAASNEVPEKVLKVVVKIKM